MNGSPASGGQRAAVTALICVAGLWSLEAADWLFGLELDRFGIVPRTASGLVGIPLSPLLHGGFEHLAANTVPFGVLATLVALRGRPAFLAYTLWITLIAGAAVWFVARGGVHLGASLLVFGYFGLLVGFALFERRLKSMLIAAVVVGLYAGLIWGVLPTRAAVSWEAHLFGALAGAMVARADSSRRPT